MKYVLLKEMARNPNDFQISQTAIHLAMGRGQNITTAMDHFMATGSILSTSTLGLMQVKPKINFIILKIILLIFNLISNFQALQNFKKLRYFFVTV